MFNISVIISTYNRYKSLRNTLDSLLNQEYKNDFNYEVIVVDNNSKDKTKETVESYMPLFNGRLKYLFEPRQGKSYALNTGIKESKGEILAFTDDDCIVDRNWLKNINDIFRNKKIDLLGGKVIPCFNSYKPGWLNIDAFKSPIVNFNLGDRYLENSERKILAAGANLIFQKESFKKYGGFNYTGRAQDTELCHRWHKLRAKIAYSPDVIVHHYNNPERLNKNYFRKYYFLCGKNHSQIFKMKYSGGRQFLNISFWVYKELMLAMLKFLIKLIFDNKNNFSKEIWIWYYLGIILGLQGYKTNFENLR